MNVLSDETVAEFLLSWRKRKTEPKKTAHGYGHDIELYLVPYLGALKMRRRRGRHAPGIFD